MKRHIKLILGILGGLILVVGITVGILMFFKTKENYEIQLKNYEGQVEALNAKLNEIKYIDGYALNYDVKSGTIIEEADLSPVEMPAEFGYDEVSRKTGYITNINDIVGQRYKTDLSAGTVMTPALVYPNELEGDLRYLDVVLDELPIGIEVGKYIDVRFQFPFGQDFIAMTHKEIVDINGNVLKLVVSQADIYVYESIQTDKSLFPNTKLYCIEYIDGGIQASAKNYYPMRIETLSAMVQDPNIGDDFDMGIYQHVDRDLLEEQIYSYMDAENNDLYSALTSYIESNQSDVKESYEEALKVYEQKQKAQNSGSSNSSTTNTEKEMNKKRAAN